MASVQDKARARPLSLSLSLFSLYQKDSPSQVCQESFAKLAQGLRKRTNQKDKHLVSFSRRSPSRRPWCTCVALDSPFSPRSCEISRVMREVSVRASLVCVDVGDAPRAVLRHRLASPCRAARRERERERKRARDSRERERYHLRVCRAFPFRFVDPKYKLLRKVGSGAYGLVVAADDISNGKQCAIKKIANAFEVSSPDRALLVQFLCLRRGGVDAQTREKQNKRERDATTCRGKRKRNESPRVRQRER